MERQTLYKLNETSIWDTVPEEALEKALETPPFISFPFPGALNFRDIGLAAPSKIKAGLLFRSGTLTMYSDAGRDKLTAGLGIKTVFDLRSQGERERQPAPEIEGIHVRWIPSTVPPTRVVLESFIDDGGATGYANMYEEVLLNDGRSSVQ
jgi:hypothetical protein